jgi:hypothetical protein
MSIITPPGQSYGLSITALCQITGLDRVDIYRAAEQAQLGAPGHFCYPRSEIVYTERGLELLCPALEQTGQAAAARILRTRLAQDRVIANVRAQSRPLGWLASWEASS